MNTNNRGGLAVAETETITVSKRFANNLREFAYLAGDERPLDQLVDERCGWVLANLVEGEATTWGELADIIYENYWESEAECRAYVDRVRPKFEKETIFEIYQDEEGWQIKLFDSRYSHWHTIWKYCQEHNALNKYEEWRDCWCPILRDCRKRGIEFAEVWKACLDGKLDEFLAPMETVEPVAA
jgi:hypothetical protein